MRLLRLAGIAPVAHAVSTSLESRSAIIHASQLSSSFDTDTGCEALRPTSSKASIGDVYKFMASGSIDIYISAYLQSHGEKRWRNLKARCASEVISRQRRELIFTRRS